MLKSVYVQVKPKKWQFKGPSRSFLISRVATRAMKMIEQRVTRQGRDGDGVRIPPLAHGGKFAIASDVRFSGGTPGRVEVSPDRWVDVFFYGDYGRAKRAAGARRKRDGRFTGDMWNSLTAELHASKKRAVLRLHFAGMGRKYAQGFTKTGRVSRRGTRNRDKATYMQFSGQGMQGRRLMTLMSLSGGEVGLLRDLVVRGIRRLI
ncbi:MAG: hypothetical protein CMK74_12360 [Pseudomonadales bacterium]|jgi:hypothetical protein|nr:hypothetical protein [Pseudomonadales bacterium]|tara:strand:- start:1201 stop:1815 length:615 start_codon:yes stop_codon:yes gene_type:complete